MAETLGEFRYDGKRLAEAPARHLARIEKLEQGRAMLLADLKKLCLVPNAEQP